MAIIGQNISYAGELLNKGGLVAIPTETVYGLAGNGLNSEVLTEIFKVKNRPFFDPMILHISDQDQIPKYVVKFPQSLRKLAEAFMPGSLSLLLEKSASVPDLLTSGSNKVALRIPDHPLTLELLRSIDFPLAAPSANPFGYISPTNAQHVQDQLDEAIPYILDGGPCRVGLESTIVTMVGDQVTVLRKGGVAIEDIEVLVGPVDVYQKSTSNPSAPGMLSSHYAPRKPLYILQEESIPKVLSHVNISVLAFDHYWSDLPLEQQVILASDGALDTAARNLFAAMRHLDTTETDCIVTTLVRESGLGRAINDKLRRASSPLIEATRN